MATKNVNVATVPNTSVPAADMTPILGLPVPPEFAHITHAKTWGDFFAFEFSSEEETGMRVPLRFIVNAMPVEAGDPHITTRESKTGLLRASFEIAAGLWQVLRPKMHVYSFDPKSSWSDNAKFMMNEAGEWEAYAWNGVSNTFVRQPGEMPVWQAWKHQMFSVATNPQCKNIATSGLTLSALATYKLLNMSVAEAIAERDAIYDRIAQGKAIEAKGRDMETSGKATLLTAPLVFSTRDGNQIEVYDQPTLLSLYNKQGELIRARYAFTPGNKRSEETLRTYAAAGCLAEVFDPQAAKAAAAK